MILNMKNIHFVVVLMLGYTTLSFGQNNYNYWQQHVDYTMEVNMDVETFNYKGVQKLVYTNNSPDTLNMVFFHL